MSNTPSTRPPLLARLPAEGPRATLRFELDGRPCTALAGDTVMTAVLTQPGRAPRLRASEPGGAPRAGFCAMGACQDCWMHTADGRRLRACTTALEDGMKLLTGPAR